MLAPFFCPPPPPAPRATWPAAVLLVLLLRRVRLDVRRPHLDQPALRPVQPHRVPPAVGGPLAGLRILLAEAEVDGGPARPVEGRGVERW